MQAIVFVLVCSLSFAFAASPFVVAPYGGSYKPPTGYGIVQAEYLFNASSVQNQFVTFYNQNQGKIPITPFSDGTINVNCNILVMGFGGQVARFGNSSGFVATYWNDLSCLWYQSNFPTGQTYFAEFNTNEPWPASISAAFLMSYTTIPLTASPNVGFAIYQYLNGSAPSPLPTPTRQPSNQAGQTATRTPAVGQTLTPGSCSGYTSLAVGGSVSGTVKSSTPVVYCSSVTGIQSGQDLYFSVVGTEVCLYVSYGSVPSSSVYDYKMCTGSAPSGSIAYLNPTNGSYFSRLTTGSSASYTLSLAIQNAS